MAKDQYMDMGLAMLNSPKTMEDGDFIELSGEIYQGKFEEFYPDMDELKEIVINLFIKKKLKRRRLKKPERKGKYNEKEVRSTSGSSRYHGSAGHSGHGCRKPEHKRDG